MHKLFTTDDIIRFAYNEMQPEEAAEFSADLYECPEMAEELELINRTREVLDGSVEVPQAGVIQSILSYSAALQIREIPSRNITLEVVFN
jgi:anti-sigma factor RsiW